MARLFDSAVLIASGCARRALLLIEIDLGLATGSGGRMLAQMQTRSWYESWRHDARLAGRKGRMGTSALQAASKRRIRWFAALACESAFEAWIAARQSPGFVHLPALPVDDRSGSYTEASGLTLDTVEIYANSRPMAAGKRKPRQLGFTFRTWGGARAGAGRPPNASVSGVSHLTRPALSRHHPVHVTLRVGRGIETLRGSAMFRAVRGALAGGRDRFGFRLVHFSVERDHLHLLAEAGDRRALSRGVQGLSIRVAKAVNRRLERRGKVFADRYHARALETPSETRRALRYVLINARKHGLHIPAGFVDARSSAPWFEGWERPSTLAFVAGERFGKAEKPVVSARTWLLRIGWRRAGPIDTDDVPGPSK